MIRAWGRIVDGPDFPWISPALVDGVDNSAGLSTGRVASAEKAGPVIHRFPRLMKERMKK
jgi:hypothetical protein